MDLGEFYHFRCHTDKIPEISTLVNFLNEQTIVMCIVKELGQREHIHSTIQLKCAKSTFIDRLKKNFPMVIGNKSYSLKAVRNFESNIRYCYKGRINDYPDILYTIHTTEEWKEYHKLWWVLQDAILTGKKKSQEQVPSCDEEIDFVKKPKVRVKTFIQKFCDMLWEDHRPVISSIWYYNKYKDGVALNSLEFCQDYVADLLFQYLGSVAKNIDDFIFERMFRGVYSFILFKCPDNITKQHSKSLLDKFRHKL